MLGLLIDALVLIALLKTIHNEDVNLLMAILVALGTAIGTWALAYALTAIMGLSGIFVAALLAAILLGVAVSALFGVEIKRSILIGGIFMLVHIGVGVGFQLLTG